MRRFIFTSRTTSGLLLIAIAVLLIALGRTGRFTPIEGVLVRVLAPVQTIFTEQFRTASASLTDELTLEELRTRNAALEAETARLQSEVVQLREAQAERDVLAAILSYARENPENTYLAADVIGRDPSPFLRFVLVNKGTTHGVFRDMPVIAAGGLVGIITEVLPTASKVLLITDPRMAVNVRLQESRADGVVVGQESGDLRMQFISLDAKVQAGDLVLTSGLGGTYPPDLLVGSVASVRHRTYDVFQEAAIQPAVDFGRLEIVLIVTDFAPTNLKPLLTTPVPAGP